MAHRQKLQYLNSFQKVLKLRIPQKPPNAPANHPPAPAAPPPAAKNASVPVRVQTDPAPNPIPNAFAPSQNPFC